MFRLSIMRRLLMIVVLCFQTTKVLPQLSTELSLGPYVMIKDMGGTMIHLGPRLAVASGGANRVGWTAGIGASIPYWRESTFTFYYNPRALASGGFDTADADVRLQERIGQVLVEAGGRLRLGSLGRNEHRSGLFVDAVLEGARWQYGARGTVRYLSDGSMRDHQSVQVTHQFGFRTGVGKRFAIGRNAVDLAASCRLFVRNYQRYGAPFTTDRFDLFMFTMSYTWRTST